jgi:hypothetical protein
MYSVFKDNKKLILGSGVVLLAAGVYYYFTKKEA